MSAPHATDDQESMVAEIGPETLAEIEAIFLQAELEDLILALASQPVIERSGG